MKEDQTTRAVGGRPVGGGAPHAGRGREGSYTVLARRYRSRDFDELVGQEPIARTLRNAVAAGRTAHAYLFCGTRGVGKTSMARILARAINVTPDLAQADQIADAILRGDDLDVIEIDGASNRGVQEARDLIAAAGLSPARCRYKIYIIDEVHMLTPPAFNTLLKTMEEPPEHVKFILCTTEPQKVPATIQSRCQRFDFRALSAAQIGEQLERVLRSEGLEAEPEVVAQVARLGRGSMRDGLSVLDRLLAAGEPRLTMELLETMLGLPDRTLVNGIVEAVAAGDARPALEAGEELLRRGSSVEQALEMIVEHLRWLLVIAVCGAETDLVDLSPGARKTVARQAERFDAAGLVHLIALCDAAARNARTSAVARSLFDAVLVRMCQSEHLADIAALLERGTAAAAGPGPKKKGTVSPPAPPPQAAPAPPSGPVLPAATVETRPPSAADGMGAALWESVVAHAAGSPREQAGLDGLLPVSFDGRTLRLKVRASDPGLARFHAARTADIAALVRRATGREVAVELDAGEVREQERRSPGRRVEEARKLPVVEAAMRIFDADVVDVQDLEPPPGDASGPESARDV